MADMEVCLPCLHVTEVKQTGKRKREYEAEGHVIAEALAIAI
jgi:hypothetical protein